MISKRLPVLIVVLALTAAACGVAQEAADDDTAATTTPAAPAASSDVQGDQAELFSPTDVDEPFDLSGGVTSSSDGLVALTDEPLGELVRDVRLATEPWPTDWTRRTIRLGELQLGIEMVDPRDRIRPIDEPKFEPIAAATWLGEREPGALVQFNDEVRFYPLSILTRHEIVNDRFGDIPVVVTYCPLCNTALSFDARVDGKTLRFGVSGLLRNSDLVMWDGATTSLWQQISGEAVVGQLAGTQLEIIPTAIVSYGRSIADSAAIGTGIAFDRSVDGQFLTFDAVDDGTFVDDKTGSTWTLLGQAVDGPLAGWQLETVTHRNEFWFAWAAFFPEAAVYGDA